MKLSFHVENNGATKYWYATTDKGGYDAEGPTIEAALAELVTVLERELDEGDS
jgi:hypothetical protein